MREIKFRVYNSNRNEMCYLLENRWSFGPFEGVRSLSWEDVFAEQYEGLIPLQYTGLKDKNGKEIYEGDIVKRTINDSKVNSFTGKVVIDEGACFIVHGEECLFLTPNLKGHKNEVIGNVYENSDLL